MNPVTAWGAVCGITLGVGLWALVSMLPRLSRPRLIHRVAPYLVDVSEGARALVARRPADPLPLFRALFAPLFSQGRTLLSAALGGPGVIAVRLRQAGSSDTVEGFRSRQLVAAIVGTGAGVVLGFVLSRVRDQPVLLHLALVLACGLAGILLWDQLLKHRADRRIRRMASELPTVLEFLTLSLSAGEGILEALRRVARIGRGELAAELSAVVGAVNTGVPLGSSLNALADGVRLPALSRCVDQIIGALERGTPLAEVLRAQAQDARDDAKRQLLESAGKKEVAMMVPLVFLILPTTIVFAIFPGIFVLQFGF
ncbi:MAG: type II secretion system F family protein [Terrimesophilobacter sp.]